MPAAVNVEVDRGALVFERPRYLGRGVEVFNADDVPITPYGSFTRPNEYPKKFNINEPSSIACQELESVQMPLDLFALHEDAGSAMQPQPLDQSFVPSTTGSFVCDERRLRHQLHRILLIGSPGLVSTHVAAGLLKHGYRVRLLERDYRGKIFLYGLESLIETRPSRLSLFYEDDLSLAVADCDGVVYVNGPDTSEISHENDIERLFVSSIQDVFLSIKRNGKSVRRVVLISPASSIFPVETTLVAKTRGLKRGQAAALKEAERLSYKAGVPLTILLPAMMVGPSLLGEGDGNVQALVLLAEQQRRFTSPIYYNIVDVRDVAEACALVLMAPRAEYQKYILSGGEMSLAQIACALQQCIPRVSPPKRHLPVWLTRVLLHLGILNFLGFEFCERVACERVGWSYVLSSLKAQRDLAIQLRSAQTAVVTAVAHAMNVPVAVQQPNVGDAHTSGKVRNQLRQSRLWRGLQLVGFSVLFATIGFFSGKRLFIRSKVI
ncbi:hypothetical protein TCDM_02466 [Trypanosoma cruzi Dm28c]|uniref:NAD-dependent epimerase/dehydratase domain-containing protein n=2 Tax=Trypanosoma cruzi TaxID=5693 RepID=V5B687_TRYCR|nr:hypothetical protein TCDM_02466 [Trypanosoma cruzi Dm28c]PBJ69040.1 hypothetical protein BCY84_20520 [Trypanosoma cruzi cruzi]PWV00079.1 putative NAD dependent epimerase/dehydratase family [Trypanosoma cruzi]